MKKYHRQDLLNLAYEMGVPIRSDLDLITFECELVINGDFDESMIEQPEAENKSLNQELLRKQDEQILLLEQIHAALFKSNDSKKPLSEEEKIKLTKASIILNGKRRNTK